MAAPESVASSQFLYGGPFNSSVGPQITAAATIAPTNGIHHCTGATPIATITVPWPGFTGTIALVPDSAFTTVATGNISLASTAVVNKTLFLAFDGSKWNPSY
jgi:hypothetical protein